MKRTMATMLTLLALIAAPLPGLAAMHEHGGSHGGSSNTGSMDHGSMGSMDHSKMAAGTTMLGEQTVDGVKAMAHLQDVKVAMVRMGRKETHHFMVAFAGTATGEQITSGAVVLRINTPSGQEGETVRLMAMEGYFGADITLAEKGAYTFTLDTKMGGPKRRQFEFKYKVK